MVGAAPVQMTVAVQSFLSNSVRPQAYLALNGFAEKQKKPCKKKKAKSDKAAKA